MCQHAAFRAEVNSVTRWRLNERLNVSVDSPHPPCFFLPFVCVAMWPRYPECTESPENSDTCVQWIYFRVCFCAVLAETFSGHRVLLSHKCSLQEQTKGKGWGSKSPTDFYFFLNFPSIGSVELGASSDTLRLLSFLSFFKLNCGYAVNSCQRRPDPEIEIATN